MKPRTPPNPERLDVAQFAHDASALDGAWAQDALPRLMAERAPHDGQDPPVRWAVQGREVRRTGEAPQVWLDVQAHTVVQLTCQRCLAPVATPLGVDRSFLFVPGGETQAAELDADSDDDVLPLERSLNLRDLVEDELIMALPIVPRHDRCPEPLRAPEVPGSVEVPDDAGRPHPFAALQALKGKLKS